MRPRTPNLPSLCLLLLTLLLLPYGPLSPARAAAPEPPHVLKMVYDPPRVLGPLVSARVNGSKPRLFLLDTGANVPLILRKEVADELKLKPTGKTGRVNDGVALRLVAVETFALVRADGQAVPVGKLTEAGILDDAEIYQSGSAVPVAGIIGMPVLAAAVTRFDFAAGTVTLVPEGGNREAAARLMRPEKPDGATVLPMNEKPKGSARYFIPLAPAPGLPAVELLLDTGEQGTSLPAATLARMRPRAAKPHGVGGVEGIYLTERVLLPALRVGDREERDVGVNAEPRRERGFLGMGLLNRFRMTLDPRGGKMLLEPSAAYRRFARVEGGLPFYLEPDGKGGYRAASVAPDSGAGRAGVRDGDRIVSADGLALAGLTQTVAEGAVAGWAGDRATLVLERAGAGADGGKVRSTVAYVRPSEFDARPLPVYGMTLFWRGGAGAPVFEVLTVREGGPAARGGLRAGDRVTAMNGKTVAGLPLEQVRAFLIRPDLELTVERGTTDRETRNLRLAATAGETPGT